MELTNETVDYLAHLSRLEFQPQEKAGILEDLQRMISFVEKLNELDTAGVEPLRHVTEQFDTLREDRIQPSLDRELALRNAPSHNDLYFKVPKVLKK